MGEGVGDGIIYNKRGTGNANKRGTGDENKRGTGNAERQGGRPARPRGYMTFHGPAPRETYSVAYEAKPSQVPAWFTIYATITKAGPAGGLQLAYRLPHTVYVLGKRSLAPDSVAVLVARAVPSDSGRRIPSAC
jgi:hypothetical protein